MLQLARAPWAGGDRVCAVFCVCLFFFFSRGFIFLFFVYYQKLLVLLAGREHVLSFKSRSLVVFVLMGVSGMF